MKTLIITFLLLLVPFVSFAQFAESIGSSNSDIGYDITHDASGNIYITGNFGGQADFDPGSGTTTLIPDGLADVFFAMYDNDGNIIWTKAIGGTSNDYGQSIAVDASGNVYITGYFQGTADFDPSEGGTTNLTSTQLDDIFFAKYDSDGNLLWANRVGDLGNDRAKSLFVDGSGNIYLTGDFEGTK
jgi:hypothetical protein